MILYCKNKLRFCRCLRNSTKLFYLVKSNFLYIYSYTNNYDLVVLFTSTDLEPFRQEEFSITIKFQGYIFSL